MQTLQKKNLKKIYVLVFGAYGGYAYLNNHYTSNQDVLFLIRYLKDQIGLVLESWLGVKAPAPCPVGDEAWLWMTDFMILLSKVYDFFEDKCWSGDQTQSFFYDLVCFY